MSNKASTGLSRVRNASKSGVRISPVQVLAAVVVLGSIAYGTARASVGSVYVMTASMEPTLQVYDRVVIHKWGQRSRSPERGDVVAYRSLPTALEEASWRNVDVPEPALPNSAYIFLHRVIGLPGDTIAIKEGQTFVNGQPLKEAYLLEDVRPKGDGSETMHETWGPATVPADHYMVLGDNRSASSDSRIWGFIHRDSIQGRAVTRVSPEGVLSDIQ